MTLTKDNIEEWKVAYNQEYERITKDPHDLGSLMSNDNIIGFYNGSTAVDAVNDELSYDEY